MQRDRISDPGVNERVVTILDDILAFLEEIDMRLRHHCWEKLGKIFERGGLVGLIISHIAPNRRVSADPDEITESANIPAQRGEHAFLVISD